MWWAPLYCEALYIMMAGDSTGRLEEASEVTAQEWMSREITILVIIETRRNSRGRKWHYNFFCEYSSTMY